MKKILKGAMILIIILSQMYRVTPLNASSIRWQVKAPNLIYNSNELWITGKVKEIVLPEKVNAQIIGYDDENNVVENFKMELDYELLNEVNFNEVGEQLINAKIIIPQLYSGGSNNIVDFYFYIEISADQKDLYLTTNYLYTVKASIFDNIEDYDLPEIVNGKIECRNNTQESISLGELSVVWDYESIVKEEADSNGEYNAVINGLVQLPQEYGNENIDGVIITQNLAIRNPNLNFGFIKKTPDKPNPIIVEQEQELICFFIKHIDEIDFQNVFVWLTEDNGHTFTNINNTNQVQFFKDDYLCLLDFEANKWYGLCIELNTQISETLYFMFDDNELSFDVSGGNRNGDGRWPFENTDDPEEEVDFEIPQEQPILSTVEIIEEQTSNIVFDYNNTIQEEIEVEVEVEVIEDIIILENKPEINVEIENTNDEIEDTIKVSDNGLLASLFEGIISFLKIIFSFLGSMFSIIIKWFKI